MSTRSLRRLLGTALVVTLPLAACTSAPTPSPEPAPPGPPAMRLVAFDSCEQLRTDLRRATRAAVGPYGLPGSFPPYAEFAQDAVGGSALKSERAAAAPVPGAYSGTNNHERDADEPDLVKTDGRRIVVVDHQKLRVVDAASRRLTGQLDLGPAARYADPQLLLAGDHALILLASPQYLGRAWGRPVSTADGSRLLLIDLTGTPRVISRYRIDGTLVDARQTGSIARVVVRSSPRLIFPDDPRATTETKRVAANRKVVDTAAATAWQPAYEVTTGQRTDRGRVGCDRISRPADYSGTSLVTVLTFDVAGPTLGTGDPVAVVADGDTVYGTGTSLYIANDRHWRSLIWRPGGAPLLPAPRTEIYRFDTTGTARPAYAATGSVPGWLVNQYALSEWDGHLRVATTTEHPDPAAIDASGPPGLESAIRVLRQDGDKLVETGKVEGLGKGERIYSVRFLGPRGYLVTFRQTDPLYSVDLADPAKPTVSGELKITGYSAHLQPAGDGRLIGIGQEADGVGRTKGTQVSLFDVADPAHPRRLARYQVTSGYSDAEHDPHALLYWPATNLLVVPLTVYDPVVKPTGPKPTALVLRVADTGLTRLATIAQPVTGSRGVPAAVRRSLVVGNVLWTVSDAGLQACDLSTLDTVGWLPTA
jgi:hypothetical protein